MNKFKKCKIIFLGIVLVVCEFSQISDAVSVKEDLSLSGKEKRALDEFKKRVSSYLLHEYMKQDIYLIKWLRARNLNLDEAEQFLKTNLQWREENKMDTILEEDFTELDRDYPYQIYLKDKEGKPIATANFGDWDIRKMAMAGKLNKLTRHLDRGFERITRNVRKLQNEGKLVTQWDFIINMENYNLPQHSCLPCLPFYLHLISSYENHYPQMADKIMSINTPAAFEMALNLMRPIMSPDTRRSFKVYNTNKKQWQAELAKIADKNELPIEYGGNREV